MRKSGLVFFLVSCCPLAFGQLDSNSITVSASRNASLQPDQAVFAVNVQSGLSASLDDVVAALHGSGITAADLSSVNTPSLIFATGGSGLPPAIPLTLNWTFSLSVPLTKTKDTVASLTTLQQTIATANNGLMLSFSIVGTQVSQQLVQSQTCSLSGLISDATAQAQALASAANLTVGRILALSSGTSSGVSGGVAFAQLSPYAISTSLAVPPPCVLTVKFVLTGY
jgi:uncharacterized protein YggE